MRVALLDTYFANNEMLVTVFFINVLLVMAYYFLKIPRLCAEVAQRRGMDEKKWYFNGMVLGVIALLYLRSTLSPSESDLRKPVDRTATISIAMLIWLVGFAIALNVLGY